MTSAAGLTGTLGQVNYSAAKAGMIGFTKSLARELARKNIMVNALAPLAATPMTETIRTNEKFAANMMERIPLKRWAGPDEIAGAFVFMASDAASYITGPGAAGRRRHGDVTRTTRGRAAPLSGITVVAMEQAVAAPMCTRVLADFGARVIKVENPNGGDFARDYDDVVNGPGGLAAHFVWCNRGKESVTLNLKSPAGMDVLHRLLDGADAFVSNLAPGATARLGFAPRRPRRAASERHPRRDRRLRTRRPDLAQARVRPSGAGGVGIVRRHRLSRTCPPNRVPRWPTSPRASTRRSRSWRCSFARDGAATVAAPAVELSLFDVMTDVMGYQLTYTQHSGIDQQPLGVGSPAVAPYGAFPTRDGQTVVLGTTNDREWQRVAREIIDRPDLADDPRFATNADRCAHRDDPRRGHRILVCSARSRSTSRRSPTRRASATRATTCPARWSPIRS